MRNLSIVILIFFLSGCGSHEDKLMGIASPNRQTVALLSRADSSAISSFSYSVHLLTPTKNNPQQGNLVFSTSDITCISLAWEDDSTIRISYVGGKPSIQLPEFKDGISPPFITVKQTSRSDCGIDVANLKQLIYAPRLRGCPSVAKDRLAFARRC